MLLRLVILAAFAGGGYLAGSLYPAPAEVLSQIDKSALERRVQSGIDYVGLERLRGVMTEEDFRRLSDEAVRLGSEAGHLIEVERVAEMADVDQHWTPASASASTPATPQAGAQATGAAFETALTFCPGMTIANRPAANAYRPLVAVNNVEIAPNPTRGACLSSGFGQRGGRMHRGVDYHSATGGPILAAGDGVVREMKYRDDYGNVVLIDHGSGVFTRYAHLSTFARDLHVGSQVRAGQEIGLMGNTAAYPIPIHLHFEVLTGDYDTPAQSFGLTARNPFGGS